jgi:excisionase family DNA binding protein
MEIKLSSIKPVKRYMTVCELSSYICKSKWWIYERVRNREIPFLLVGRQPRFDVKVIDAWLSKKLVDCVAA